MLVQANKNEFILFVKLSARSADYKNKGDEKTNKNVTKPALAVAGAEEYRTS